MDPCRQQQHPKPTFPGLPVALLDVADANGGGSQQIVLHEQIVSGTAANGSPLAIGLLVVMLTWYPGCRVKVSSRLDLCVLPESPDIQPADDGLFLRGIEAGWWTAAGGAGSQPIVPGGFLRLRRERWGASVLYANGQGGFRVRCPKTSVPAVSAFTKALPLFRAGGPRHLLCDCGELHDLNALQFFPAAGFARLAWCFDAVGAAELSAEVQAAFSECFGGHRLVFRRVG